MYHPFSIAETIGTAWGVLKKNFVPVIVYSTITFTLLAIVNFVNEFVNINHDFTVTVIMFVIIMFIQAYTTLGLYKLTFTLIDSEFYEFHIQQVIPTFKMVVSFIAISLLTAFIFVSLDLLVRSLLKKNSTLLTISEAGELAILFYLTVRCIFCICYIVDDHSGPIESLSQSFHLTKGYISKILLLLVISIVLIILGYALPKMLGVIITYPLVNIILMVSYRKLIYSHQDVDDVVAEAI